MKRYQIIGQGLAGTILALTLLDRGCDVRIVDKFDSGSSSQVAGGMFNPVTGKHLGKTWMADEIFPFLFDFYRKWEKKLKTKFFLSIAISSIISKRRK